MSTPVRNRNKIRTTAPMTGRYVVARERAQRHAEEIERDRAYTAGEPWGLSDCQRQERDRAYIAGGGFVDVTHLPYDLKDRD